jgi:elongation factor G
LKGRGFRYALVNHSCAQQSRPVSEANTQGRAVISVAVSLIAYDDRERFQRVLLDIAQQDPAVRITTESIDGQTILSGMSELHLEAICDSISHEHKIQLDVGEPRVIYLETLRRPAEAEGKYIRQTGGSGNYGHVKIRLEPNEAGMGFEFINDIRNGAVPQEYIEPIEHGIRDALPGGVLFGYEVVDVKATLFDGSYHDIDSNEIAFKIAASMAFKEAARKANPVLLEPVMSVEVVAPEEYLGTVIDDLNLRRGRIEGMELRAGLQVIKAHVPLNEMLRSSRWGRPEYAMHFTRYEEAHSPPGESGEDKAGITANNPKRPKAGSGFAAAELDAESE